MEEGNRVRKSCKSAKKSCSSGHKKSLALLCATCAIYAFSSPVHAQDGAAVDENGGIQDIIVTAQKKNERLQDVPVSVQVMASEAFAKRNLTDLSVVAQIIPSVNVSVNPRGGDLYIRGIGSGQNQSFDQSVGTFIDDIYHGRAHTTSATFLDLDRLEVLKGPQSTFFGNNAIAGALNIITMKPGNRLEAKGRALYGEDGQFAFEGAVGGPISDTIGIRVAATYNGGNGWIRNINADRDEPHVRNWAVRGTLAFDPTDDFSAIVKYEHSDARQKGSTYLQMINCPPPLPFVASGLCAQALAEGVPVGIDDNRNSKIADDGTAFKNDEYVLSMNYHLGAATLTSITGYYNYDFNVNAGIFLPEPPLTAHAPEIYRQLSQEIRLASDNDGPIQYLVGAYYQADRLHFSQVFNYFFLDPVISSVPAFAPLVPYLPLSQTNDYRQHERSYAVFGSLTWNVTDALKLTGGLRGSWVRKRFDLAGSFGTATQPFGGAVLLPTNLQALASAIGVGQAAQLAGRRKDNAWLPSARLQYNFERDVMIYATYSKGFKAGGFNGADTSGVLSNLDFDPEYVNAYEIGLKSKWLNNRLLVNIAAFRSDYSDLQVSVNVTNSNGGVVNIIKNAASSRSQGIELETVVAVTPQFRLTFNGTYLDAKNVNYPNATPNMLQLFNGQATQDLSGRRTPFAPKWSGNLAANYDIDLSDRLRLAAEGSMFFSSHYYLDGTDDPLVDQEAYSRIDGRISIETRDDRWALDLIAKNLTNKNIIVYGQAMPFSPGSTGIQKQQPRNFAVQLRFKW